MIQIPLLLMSDSIAGSSGLGRIARDLSVRIHADPALSSRFRLASFGVGGPISTSSRFPFQNGSILRLHQMIPLDLADFWIDHAGHYGDSKQEDSAEDLQERRGQVRKGILFTIWNLSWTQWLAQPELLPPNFPLRDFLLSRPFSRWLYCPIDGHLPDGTLGHQLAPILLGFDRLLAYTRYGADVIERTLEKWGGQPAVSAVNSIPDLPHGLDTAIFRPRDRALARQTFFSRVSNGASTLLLQDDQVLLSAIGTNTPRKDWGLAFQTCAELLRRGRNVFFWGHTDCLTAPPGHWNLAELVKQFGMEQRTCLTISRLSDDDMTWCYSAMDVMLGIGAGEGWGLPMSEGMACGLPVIHGNYAGGIEFIPSRWLVNPASYHLENPFLIQRPIFSPVDWADKVDEIGSVPADRSCLRSLLDPKFEWNNCWPAWREWLLAGLKAGIE